MVDDRLEESGCPEVSTVADYVDGLLAAGQAAEVSSHIDTCARCRRRVSAAVRARALDERGPSGPAAAEGSGLLTTEEHYASTIVDRPGPAAASGQAEGESGCPAGAGASSMGSGSRLAAESSPAIPADLAAGPSADSHQPRFGRGQEIDRYLILSHIGSGGMGDVYSAYDPELNRRVAIKVAKVEGSQPSASLLRARFLREARAMAQLSHRNVVSVYDVGEIDGQPFLAMELIDGEAIQQWLRAQPRSWREVLAVFVQVGHGLAAAHQAGLVHRDIKPSNILRAHDGRVCITDFGLARSLLAAEVADAGEGAGLLSTASAMAALMTQHGALVGTPAYMAPEQHQGLAADARTDQFCFCVALYEALYGQRPFAGSTLRDAAAAVATGRPRPPPAKTLVPKRLFRVLARGLRARPEERYPTMAVLLHHLGRRPWYLKRRWLVAALLLLPLALGLAHYRQRLRDAELRCRGAEQELRGVWDDARRKDIRAAFLAASRTSGERSFSGVVAALDAYTRSWLAMRVESCEAARSSGKQSEEMYERRRHCLDRRLREVSTLSDLFVRADSATVARALQATATMTRLEDCATSGGSEPPLPSDRGLRQRVDAIRLELTAAATLREAGKYRPAAGQATLALGQARKLGYRPVEAEALFLLGRAQRSLGEWRAGQQTLEEALWVAEACGHDEIAARSLAQLILDEGYGQSPLEAAEALARRATAITERMGHPDGVEIEVQMSLGSLARRQGDYPASLRARSRALELAERLYGKDSYRAANRLLALATALADVGRYAEAEAGCRSALATVERLFGAEHPIAAIAERDLGTVATALGRYDEAARRLERALAIFEAMLGMHPMTAEAINQLGVTYRAWGRYPRALELQRRALVVGEKVLGPSRLEMVGFRLELGATLLGAMGDLAGADDLIVRAVAEREKFYRPGHPEIAAALLVLADLRLRQGRGPEALTLYQRALRIFEQTLGPVHPGVARALAGEAEALRNQGHFDQALARAKQALAGGEQALGRDHPWLARPLLSLGEVYLATRQPESARPLLERAVALLEAVQQGASDLARPRLALARALSSSRR